MMKICSTSCFLKWCALAICISLPIVEAGYWITDGYPFLQPFFNPKPLTSYGNYTLDWAGLSNLQIFLAFLVNLIPLTFSMLALLFLAKLFYAFERCKIFEKENVGILKRVGWMLVWGQLIFPFYVALLSLVLTYRNPVGERMISVSFRLAQLEVLLIGLAIILASWVFERAVELKEEQEGTV